MLAPSFPIVFIRYYGYLGAMSESNAIVIDVWSDVQCPFCYIGKRQLEQALSAFEHRDRVHITWHSYQLDPGLSTHQGDSIYEYLARKLSMGLDASIAMHAQVARTAQAHGLVYNFDRMVVANTGSAHRLIQLAGDLGLAMHLEEALFRSYFTEGKNLSDHSFLHGLAQEVGIPGILATAALEDQEGIWAKRVMADAMAAREAGCTGVPFFVVNKRLKISGAQGAGRILSSIASA